MSVAVPIPPACPAPPPPPWPGGPPAGRATSTVTVTPGVTLEAVADVALWKAVELSIGIWTVAPDASVSVIEVDVIDDTVPSTVVDPPGPKPPGPPKPP